jgi:hypothetical protein
MRIPSKLWLISLAFGLTALHAQTAKPLLIANARIEVGNGQLIDSGSILISDGKIQQIGDSITPPADADVLDAKGMTVYPGFFDAYCTRGLKLPEWPTVLRRDIRTQAPPNMDSDNKKGLRPELKASDCLDFANNVNDWLAAGFTSVYLAPASGTFRGQGALLDLSADAKTLELPAFGQLIAFSTAGGEGYPGSLLGFIAFIRQCLLDAQRYTQLAKPEKSDWMEALKPLVEGRTPAVFQADSEREIWRALNICDEFRLLPILAGARDGFRQIDHIKSSGAKLLVSVAIGPEPSKTPPAGETSDATPQEVLNERWDRWHERALNAVELSKAGVEFALCSDGDAGGFLTNVRRLIKLGLDRSAALKALTVDAARIFGVQDRLGTVEKGKIANLILMSGDFADSGEVKYAIVNGVKYEIKK